MEENILKKVMENRELFVPSLFTDRQITIIEKYLNHHHLDDTEKAYFYSTIKKKIEALRTLKDEFYITGEGMIPERMEKAKLILKELKKEKAFISGSFLYKKDHEDIDIYVLSKRRKSYHKGNNHFIFISDNDLRKPLFYSALKYSVATFFPSLTPLIKRPELQDLVITYEMAITEVFNKDDLKALREFVFEYYLQIKKEILDSYSLFKKTEEIKNNGDKEKIRIINLIAKELFVKTYSKKYSYNYFSSFVKKLKEDVKIEPYENFFVYISLGNEVKHECRRAEA